MSSVRVRRSLNFKFVFVSTGIILLVCTLACGAWRAILWVDDRALEQVANRIGVTPTLANIHKHLENSIQIGMSRQEVERVLGHIAPMVVRHGNFNAKLGVACDGIVLKIGPFFARSDMNACYDQQGMLMRYQIIGD